MERKHLRCVIGKGCSKFPEIVHNSSGIFRKRKKKRATLAKTESKDRSLDLDDRNQFSDDWKVTRKELQANSYLLFCLQDYDNTFKEIPRSHIILSAWHQTKFPVDS